MWDYIGNDIDIRKFIIRFRRNPALLKRFIKNLDNSKIQKFFEHVDSERYVCSDELINMAIDPESQKIWLEEYQKQMKKNASDLKTALNNDELDDYLEEEMLDFFKDIDNKSEEEIEDFYEKNWGEGSDYQENFVPIDAYIDNDFWHELIDDFCHLDLKGFLTTFLNNLKKTIDLLPLGISTNKFKEEDWKKLYNYREINYDKQITYKYYKSKLLTTVPLINSVILQIELNYYLNEIDMAFKRRPLAFYSKFDPCNLFNFILYKKFGPNIDINSVEDYKAELRRNAEFYTGWKNAKFLVDEYWFWLWVYDNIRLFCQTTLKNMAEHAKMYSWETYVDFENRYCIYEEDKNTKEEIKCQHNCNSCKKAHNAYTDEEMKTWLESKNLYNEICGQYRLLKFLTREILNQRNYITLNRDFEKIGFDVLETKAFKEIRSNIYSCDYNCEICKNKKGANCKEFNLETIFDNLKSYIQRNFMFISDTLFEELKIDSISNLSAKLDNISKKDFGLKIIKNIYPLLSDKSDKNIENKFATLNEISEQNPMDKIKEDFYNSKFTKDFEKIMLSMKAIAETLIVFYDKPTLETKRFLYENIEEIFSVLKTQKKSQPKLLFLKKQNFN